MKVLQAPVLADDGRLRPRRFEIVNGMRIWLDPMPARWERENWRVDDGSGSCLDETAETGV